MGRDSANVESKIVQNTNQRKRICNNQMFEEDEGGFFGNTANKKE